MAVMIESTTSEFVASPLRLPLPLMQPPQVLCRDKPILHMRMSRLDITWRTPRDTPAITHDLLTRCALQTSTCEKMRRKSCHAIQKVPVSSLVRPYSRSSRSRSAVVISGDLLP